jgi:hypothetical protein
MASYHDSDSGITLDSEFESASARGFSKIGPGHYQVDLLIENYSPDYPVVWEYMFCFRVRSQSVQAQKVTFRVMKGRGGISYIDGPHFAKRNGNWEVIPRAQTELSKEYVEVTLDVAAGDEFLLGNHPFPTTGEVESDMHAAAAALDEFSVREFGRTPEGRPLLALESEPRDKVVIVFDTMQPAEPGDVPILFLAHWLCSRSAETEKLLQDYQFCLLPLTNPDGTAHGHSVTNAAGEVPRCHFEDAKLGKPVPGESKAIWDYMAEKAPNLFIEFHIHYLVSAPHKLVGIAVNEPSDERGVVALPAATVLWGEMLKLNSQWRARLIEAESDTFRNALDATLARDFGTLAYVYQIYAPTVPAACAHAVDVLRATLQGAEAASALSLINA